MSSTRNNEPIHLFRGERWDDTTWSIHGPAVKRAAQKADQGLDHLGITYDQWKVGLIHNAEISLGEVLHLGGTILNAVNYLIYTKKTAQERPRAAYNAAQWSTTIVHEVTHAARLERYPSMYDPIEIIASEGLAYEAQRLYIAAFCGKQLVHHFFEHELEQPDPELQARLKDISAGNGTHIESLEWLKTIDPGNPANNGSLIGAQLVHQQIEKGYTLPDLMNQPPEDILGL